MAELNKVMVGAGGNFFSELNIYEILGGIRLVNTASPNALVKGDGVILFDTTSTGISIDLPSASVGQIRIPFKDTGANSSENNITFNCVGSDTIIDSKTNQTSTIIASDGFSGYFLSNGVDTWNLL